MSDLGNIDRVVKESIVPDHDWLDVDEEDYRASEKLPKQNLDAVPDLENEWGDVQEYENKSEFKLSPNNQKPNTSFWSEKDVPGRLTEEDTREIVEKFAKNKVQSGVTGKELVNSLRSSFDSQVLSSAKDVLKDVLSEQGLLGRVYIDSQLFSDCYKGHQTKNLTAHNRQAQYVKGKSDCHGCVHNKNGRCSVFEKDIIFKVEDIDYDGVWEDFKPHFEVERKDLDGIENLPPREKLKQAVLAPEKDGHDELDRKPIQPDPADQVTSEEADKNLEEYDPKREVVEDVYRNKKLRYTAKVLMSGNHSKEIYDSIEMDPDLSKLKKKSSLLGKLYIDLSYFPTYKEASDFVSDLDTVPPVVVGIPYEEDEVKNDSQKVAFDPKSKKALAHILNRYFLVKNGYSDFSEDDKESLNKLFKRLRKSSQENVLRFASSVYEKPVPQKVREYEAKLVHDPTKGITPEEADKRLEEVDRTQEKAEDPVVASNRKALVTSMLEGNHGKEVRSKIKVSNFDDLENHINLLGQLYVDTSVVTPDMIHEASNDKIKSLPLKTPSNSDEFFQKDEVKNRIADRLAEVKGVTKNPKYSELKNKIISNLNDKSNKFIEKFARKVFSMGYEKRTKEHDTPYEISPERNSEARHAYREEYPDKSSYTLRDYLKEEGGKDLLASLKERVGLQEVRDVYLDQDTTIASKVKTDSGRKKAKKIMSAALNPDFNSKGRRPPTKSMFDSEMGHWLRDRLQEGRHGRDLVASIQDNFKNSTILEESPVIIAFREEEGLYGRAYSTADSYSNCREGKEKISSTVNQIVKGSKCEGCMYNKMDHCMLYGQKLVDKPEYDNKTVMTAIEHRLNQGDFDKKFAKKLRSIDVDAKTKTRAAYIKDQPKQTRVHDSGLQAHHGYQSDPDMKGVDPDKIQELVENKEKKKREALKEIDFSSKDAPSGTEMMKDFELDKSEHPMADFNLHSERKTRDLDSSEMELDEGFDL